jgi:hypothetical protein
MRIDRSIALRHNIMRMSFLFRERFRKKFFNFIIFKEFCISPPAHARKPKQLEVKSITDHNSCQSTGSRIQETESRSRETEFKNKVLGLELPVLWKMNFIPEEDMLSLCK